MKQRNLDGGRYESASGLIELVVERGDDLLNMQSVHSQGALAPTQGLKERGQ